MAVLVDENNDLKEPGIKLVLSSIAKFRRENFVEATGKNRMFNQNKGGLVYATLNDVLKVLKHTDKYNIEWYQYFNAGYLCTRIVHIPSGQFIESLLEVKAEKDTYHSYGSAISYLRRYSLITMFGLQDEDDDGNMASRGYPKPFENNTSSQINRNGGNSSSPTISVLEKELAKLNNVKDINAYWRTHYQAEGKKLTFEEEQVFSKRKGELK